MISSIKASEAMRAHRYPWLLLVGVAAAYLWGNSVTAATITVLNNNDSGAGSLRQALLQAASGDTVNFASGGLQGGQTIMLTTTVTTGGVASGLAVPVNVTITGVGSVPVTIVDSLTRPFNFAAAGLTAVQLQNLAIQSSASDGEIGGVVRSDVGSANFVLTIDSCTINGTNSGNSGGAIASSVADKLIIRNSTIGGSMTATGNQNHRGGAIATGTGITQIVDTTIAGSTSATTGGAIAIGSGTVSLTFTTVSGNTASGSGGGIYIDGGTLYLNSTIVAGNHDSSGQTDIVRNSAQATVGATDSLIQNPGGSLNGFTFGNIVGQDPLLGSLQDNGGPTKTMALSVGSPAVNTADVCDEVTAQYHDQRGPNYPRVWNGRPDIGAVEQGDPPDLLFRNDFEMRVVCM